MRFRATRRLGAAVVVVVGSLVADTALRPGPERAGAAEGPGAGRPGPETVVARFTGRFANSSTEPTRTTWVGDIRDPATGRLIGSMTHDSYPVRPGEADSPVLHIVNTFRLAGGTITIRAVESAVPDPVHAGFFLVGVHPDSATVVSSTGRYAGHSGTTRMAGRHDGRELPGHATFDDFWLIELRSTRTGQRSAGGAQR